MTVRIKKVTTDHELKLFLRFPEQLYNNNSYRVPPLFKNEYRMLHKDINPAFEHCEARYWLASKGNRIVGRVAGILNVAHQKEWGQKYLRFAWLDFEDDALISELLLNEVELWANKTGALAVHGPLGFTDHDPVGILVEGFSELGTSATRYNYPYYSVHLENLGYHKDIDWVEYEIQVPDPPLENIRRIATTVMRRYNLKLLEVDKKKDLLPYGEELFRLLMKTHDHLYGVVSLTLKQIEFYIKQYWDVINPEFVQVITDQDNNVVGFGFTIPSLSYALQRAKGKLFPLGFIYILRALAKNECADLCLIAIDPKYQGKGVNAILLNRINMIFNKFGIVRVESNPELENNRLIQQQWKYFERRQHKRRRCYIKYLE
ncbi:GNAT family N-acetyltransferase [Carboxylicivirga marina]|uniref:GNAT family N-acetyltransferase n=1 Tax=Carboxylicivirga marina TaxID=2800988 RepID=UPI002591CFB6|nr:GNAT family N-acetyltransferase [uncultured Carboxylicivirga sp.]